MERYDTIVLYTKYVQIKYRYNFSMQIHDGLQQALIITNHNQMNGTIDNMRVDNILCTIFQAFVFFLSRTTVARYGNIKTVDRIFEFFYR